MAQRIRSRRPARPLVEALDARVLFKTIYVDVNASMAGNGMSWTFPMQSLQQALSMAVPGDQVRVADGVYKPTTTADRGISFQLKQAVQILGGYAGNGAPDPNARDVSLYPTILSGDIGAAGTPTDNSFHVVTASAVNATAVLDGFTITGGYAIAGGTGAAESDKGGGVLIRNAGPTVANCTITGNRAASQGEGMFIGGFSPTSLASPVITGCRIADNGVRSGNNSGGGIYAEFSALTLTNTVFDNNAAYIGAGAVHTTRSTVTLTGCTFTNNWARYGGAALSLDQGTNATVTNCTFSGNITQLSGTVRNLGSSTSPTISTFTGCTFTGNVANSGGGILNDISATATIDRCTFVRNTATAGGAVYTWQGKVTLTNSRFLGNAAVTTNPEGSGGGGAEGGALYTLNSSPAHRAFIVNCEFVGNRAARGGAVMERGIMGSAVHNSTFTANAASASGGAIEATDGSSMPTKVVNSILWGNTAPAGAQVAAGATPPSISWSDVQGGWPSVGNIDADPVFVGDPAAGADSAWGTADDDYGDLRLQIQSPCIDAASSADVAANYPTDINGLERRFDFPGVGITRPAPDMGAHEMGLRLPLLRVAAGQTLALGAGGYTLVVERLELGAGALLDVADNALVLEGVALPAVQSLVTQGYNGGNWLGAAGITSSAAAADPAQRTAVGYADNRELGLAEFGGINGLTTDAVLVKYTYYGDADLTGVVDTDDFQLFLAGYQDSSLPRTWLYGDFDYTNSVDTDDFQTFLYGHQNQDEPL